MLRQLGYEACDISSTCSVKVCVLCRGIDHLPDSSMFVLAIASLPISLFLRMVVTCGLKVSMLGHRGVLLLMIHVSVCRL